MSQASVRIRLFGPPEFRVNGDPLPRLKTRKGLFILALLILRHGREVERGWLAGTLWPENDDATALTYLRQALTDLRRALGDEAAGRLVSPSPRTLRLDVDGAAADVDFVTFERCLKRGDTESLERAVALYRGPLLEGWGEEWLLGEREACQQSYLGALETLARQATAAENGDTAATVRYLRLIVAADPLRESACRALMQALAATRDYGAVTQAYRDLRTVLRREVNAEPDAETQSLFARIRAEARRQAVTPPARPDPSPIAAEGQRSASRLVSLPRPLNEFIGRGREVKAVKQALTASRLVTLTGIGGVGKTRLALRVAEEIADDFPEGVRFVDLSPVADPALVAKATAVALGVVEQAGRPLTATVCDALRERHLLLILDNCEHLPDECARFTATLLQQCPDVCLLATSRQRLGIAGETVQRVPPLTLPDRKRLPGDEKNAAAALLDFEAVRLFVDRAERVQPNLRLNPPTLRAIADICGRLDGIPLALELAAARMSALGAEQIAARLAKRLRLLSSGGAGDRTAPARQRTLRAALDWSYDLLSPEERILLGRLSVFAGGWTLEAAEAVCAGNGLEEWEVLDCLTALTDHSLVLMESEGGSVRYRLLETVREYAQEGLWERAGDEPAWLGRQHREYFLRLAQDAVPHLAGSEQAEWLDRLEREHDNLRAALDGCLEEGTAEGVRTGLRIAGDLRQFWVQRGHAGEGRRRFAALLSRDSPEPTSERARALEGAGGLAYRQGDYAAARAALEEALAVHRQRGDRAAEAVPLSLLGSVAQAQGDYPGARTLLGQALPLHRAAGNRAREAAALSALGNAAVKQGDLAEARVLFEEALAISREIGDRAMEGSILNGLGMLAAYQKDRVGARTWFEQSLARNREIGDPVQVMVNLLNLANTANELGDPAVAEDYLRQALVLNRDLGESRSQRLIALLLEGMATARARSQPERAARLLGAADAQFDAIGVMRTAAADQESYDRLLTNLRAALGEERFASCRDEGRALRVDQALSVALEQ